MPPAILHLEGYGLAPGCFADLVVLDAADPIDAIRTEGGAAPGSAARQDDRQRSASSARASICLVAPRRSGGRGR